ncbi:ABC transporter ATP-binding protein [Mycobacterium servetii]|uniref:ABC transporter ATP-binding protein n=1 Tax=Mycobacterium servetii TaxID=3237418 RepID=A0ABV4C1J0_9MYCO
MASVSFERATRRYPGADRPALDGLDLVVGDGEFVVLVGPSGCGKTTSLRMVAGLETLDSGRIRIGDRDVTDVDPKYRDVAMVFQNYALYPHMTVAQNMGFALKIARTPKAEIRERVLAAADLLDLRPHLDRKPKDLSGGQRQRVAMGRALVRRPQVFLMDEPLSNLDAKLRVQTRNQIAALQRRLGTTTVYVTHDQVEAMTMGDRVAVLCDGVLQQVAAPRELYRNPANVFVAGFIGSPAMNLFTLPIVHSSVSLGDWPIQVPREIAARAAQVVVGVRPEHFEVGGPGAQGGVEMQVDVVEELGADAYLYGRIILSGNAVDQTVVARADGRRPPERGSRVCLHPEPGHVHFFGADGRRIPVELPSGVRPGDPSDRG